jgi:hypothetical protein
MKRLLHILSDLIIFYSRLMRLIHAKALRKRFASHRQRFVFDPCGVYTFETFHVGHDVNFGYCPS